MANGSGFESIWKAELEELLTFTLTMTESWDPNLFLYAGHPGHFGVDDLDNGFPHTLDISMDFPSAAISSTSPACMDSSIDHGSYMNVDFTSPVSEHYHEPVPSLAPSHVDPLKLEQTHMMTKIPVPHITKRSRGRKVPTGGPSDVQSGDMDRRHTCGYCGGQFKRGEHLKRHIRSIHTDDRRALFGSVDSDLN